MSSFLSKIHILKDDITKQSVDAIVNAANPSLLGGGGVDGAIHRAAGPELLKECKKTGGCDHGEARITGAYNLPARHVIHTPGPVYRDGKSGEDRVLRNSYENSLNLAKQNSVSSIAFPAISAGIYGYPPEQACKIAVDTTITFMKKNSYEIDVYFVLFDEKNYAIYNNYLNTLKNEAI